MAKPRVFISSTFYDLKQVRSDLDNFIETIGYETIRNEEGNIPYGKEEALEEYCYKEIKNIDIFVSIIGGRFGSESLRQNNSISQIELITALKEEKQVYIFIEKNVLSEFETFLINKDTSIKYRYVDDIRIYQFIEEVKNLNSNNNIKGFETATDITRYLKEQLAGLFQRFLDEQTRIKELSIIKNLEKTALTLNKLVNLISEDNKGKTEEINKILMINHPLVETLRTKLNIDYNFYIEGFLDLNQLLSARRFYKMDADPREQSDVFLWRRTLSRKITDLSISQTLFDEDGKLKFIKKTDWSDKNVIIIETEIPAATYNSDDNLPF